MTRPEFPRLPYVPKLRKAALRRGIHQAINYNKKHELTTAEALGYVLDGVNGGHYDWTPEDGTHIERLDTNAVRQALKKSIKYCRTFPERVDPLGQLYRFLAIVDEGRFDPKHQTAVSGPEKLEATSVRLEHLQASQIDAQRLPVASVSHETLTASTIQVGIITPDGYIDTDDIEPW